MRSPKYNPEIHHRQSIRMKGFDYRTQGFYFATICTRNREALFGEVEGGTIKLNEFGQMVAKTWKWLEKQYHYVELDEWMVMPNHFHGILVMNGMHCRGGSRTAPTVENHDSIAPLNLRGAPESP